MVYGLILYTVIAVSNSGTIHKDWKLLAEFRSENVVEAYQLCNEASSTLVVATKQKPTEIESNYKCVRLSGMEPKSKVYRHKNGRIMQPNPVDGSCWGPNEFGCSNVQRGD